MRVTLPLLLATLGAAECERTPPEDFATRRPESVVTPAAVPVPAPLPDASHVAIHAPSALAGRCVSPTPSQAPPLATAAPASACPPDPEVGVGKNLPAVRMAFPDARETAVDAEVVRSEHDTTRGLMFRTSMAEDHGMLFDLGTRMDHKFWMHNTCIPLDLLYIDDDGLIVGIVESAPTLNDAPRGVGCPSVYVLEVNAGWSRRHGVTAGQRVELPKKLP